MTATGVPSRILAAWAAGGLDRAVWLDGGPGGRGLCAAGPDAELVADELSALAEVDAAWRRDRTRPWVGFLTYELGTDALLGRAGRRRGLPGACLRRYPGAAWLRGDALDRVDAAAHGLLAALEAAPAWRGGPWPLHPPTPVLSPEVYRARVAAAREHVAAGDTYQVNLSQPFFSPWTEAARRRPLRQRAADAYAAVRARRPATMGALYDVGDGRTILSNSPETLVDVRFGRGDGGGDRVRAWPIKGTRPRGRDAAADALAVRELLASDKDRAEHVMIVDLVRNDLGRVCVPGSIRAAATPSVLTLPTVHHLVTEVRGTLRAGVDLRTLCEAVFPGGSITGAPKRRTCEIIETLEDHERGVYCGAIVLLEPDGLRMSIPIRTGLLDASGLALHAGGGIVIDSDPEAERLETLTKTLAFMPPAPGLATRGEPASNAERLRPNRRALAP